MCVDSGASHDLFNSRDNFLSYQDLTGSGKYVALADDSKVPIMGIGTIQITLAGQIVRLNNVYHVPSLDCSLFAIRIHRRRGIGCSFLADHSGCFLSFPGFTLEIEDSTDVSLPAYQHSDHSAKPDYSDHRSTQQSH